MNNFFQLTKDGQKPKFYKKLTELCQFNGLVYHQVYNQVGGGRNAKDEFIGDGYKIEKHSFESAVNPAVMEQLNGLQNGTV